MKYRSGFVSNSSSSSFVLNKHYISAYQLDKLLNPKLEDAKDIYTNIFEGEDPSDVPSFENWCQNIFGWIDDVGGWTVIDKSQEIEFSTTLDNFQYDEYARLLGIDKRAFGQREDI